MRNKTIQQQNCNKAIKETTTKINQSGPIVTQNKKKTGFEKTKMLPLTNKELKSHEDATKYVIFMKNIS